VEFRQPVANTLEQQLKLDSSPIELTLSKGLDKINAIYRVKSIKPLVKNFRKSRQRLKAIQAKSKTLLSRKEKRILKRLERAPKGAKVPELGGIYKIQFDLEPGQSLLEVVEAYQSNPDVEYAELNYIVSICRTPDDPLYSIQWPLHNTGQMYPESGKYNHPPGTPDSDIDAPAAWSIIREASEIVIAVLDTGVDYNHRDLAANMWTDANGCHGYDFINDDNDPMDDHGHGTHCSGIIAAEGNNELDIAGVCWEAQIMALKFLGSGGHGDTADAVKAVYYAVENGADVISNSWGGFIGYPTSLERAFDYAYSQGVIAVASAGNFGSELINYPAIFEHVIAVAATDSDDERAPFSSYGDAVDIAAPGVDVLSLRAAGTSAGTTYDAYTTILSGTSMACPHVSGTFALILSLYPDIDIDNAKDIVMDNTDWIDPEICISGRLNLYRAILAVADFYAGTLSFDREMYSCSDVVQIWLSDLHLAGNGTQDINVSTSGGDSETVTLVETVPSSSGAFYGTISIDSNELVIGNGTLQLSDGETFTATYEDEDDGTGDDETVTETGLADCEAPLIFNVQIDVPGPEPIVSFETNEPTIASVLCALECGGPYVLERSDHDWANRHTIRLSGVSPFTDYFFVVQALDLVGNETIDDNAGQCYAFTTTGPCDMFVPGEYATIQSAIDKAWEGSTIWVARGRYTGAGNRDIDFLGKAVTVRSMEPNDPAIVAATIIDCNGTPAEHHRGFYFQSDEDANSVLAGFTIINGYEAVGGAIFCFYSSPTIANCVIKASRSEIYGGAISCIRSSPVITKCALSGNTAKYGGGISCGESSATITNCIINGNKAKAGGGIMCVIGSPTIINSTINANLAGIGGGIVGLRTTDTIRNCIICDNVASEAPQLASHANPVYNCIQDWTGGQGNIDVDPCFVDMGYWDSNGTPDDSNDDFWVEGDYHLKSEGWRWDRDANQWSWDNVTSRCIDAGNPGSDLGDEAVTLEVDPLNRCGQNLRINMGAYGGTAQASMPPYGWAVRADLTNDGVVDFLDLAQWTENWLSNEGERPSDLNRNAIVDMLDFALFTNDWFSETTWHE
jgi:subtilisin family serine protease